MHTLNSSLPFWGSQVIAWLLFKYHPDLRELDYRRHRSARPARMQINLYSSIASSSLLCFLPIHVFPERTSAGLDHSYSSILGAVHLYERNMPLCEF